MPYRADRAPHELLPIMPPSVARFDVDVSGANMQAVRAGRLVQIILDEPRLHARRHRLGVEADQSMHVARHVEHDGAPDRLAGETRPRATRQHRHVEPAGDLDRRRDVVRIARERDA